VFQEFEASFMGHDGIPYNYTWNQNIPQKFRLVSTKLSIQMMGTWEEINFVMPTFVIRLNGLCHFRYHCLTTCIFFLFSFNIFSTRKLERLLSGNDLLLRLIKMCIVDSGWEFNLEQN